MVLCARRDTAGPNTPSLTLPLKGGGNLFAAGTANSLPLDGGGLGWG